MERWRQSDQEVEVGHPRQLGCAQQESAALRCCCWEVWVGEDALSWRLARSTLAGAPESQIDEVLHVNAGPGLREALCEEEGPD
eukprot:298144-Rhodomonas_salina.1